MSNHLDPDQNQRSVHPDWVQIGQKGIKNI